MGNKITVTVPGKVMLLGEHSVVYGGLCLSSAVNKYITVTVSQSSTHKDEIFLPEKTGNQFILSSLNSLRNSYKTPPLSIHTTSDITGLGLGSSSAVVLGIIKGISSFLSLSLSNRKIFDISYRTVLGVQKIASGFDIATSLYGGTILFNGKTKKSEIISKESLPISVFFSGKKASTTSLIKKVRTEYEKNPEKLKDFFGKIENCVTEAKISLLKKDWEKLGVAMNKNHFLLKELGVSTVYLDQIVETAQKSGAYGAKLSGAGGGDCIIVLTPGNRKEKIASSLESIGAKHLDISVGGSEGARIKET